jgi:hypothetical protein
MALSQIQKAIDTMSTWADKINAAFHLVDTNRVDINGHNTEIAANLTYIGENQIAIADNVTAIGLNAGGITTLDGEMDNAEGRLDALEVVPGTAVPVPADTFVFIDLDDGLEYTTSIRDAIGASQLNAMASGSASAFVSSATPTAIAAFGTTFYTSTATGITDSGDGTGLTLQVPVKYKISISASLEAATNDFLFQIYVGDTAIGRLVQATGVGPNKFSNFMLQAVTTTTVTPGDKVELRIHDTGDTITSLGADMFVDFAGT